MKKQNDTEKTAITSNGVLAEVDFLSVGKTVFFSKVEEYWDKPFVMKRHHVYDTKSIILRGVITNVKGDEFMARLTDNNGFEKDGEEYVFHKNSLLSNQNYTDFETLGRWRKN